MLYKICVWCVCVGKNRSSRPADGPLTAVVLKGRMIYVLGDGSICQEFSSERSGPGMSELRLRNTLNLKHGVITFKFSS